MSVFHHLELLPLKLRVQNCPQREIGRPQQMQGLKMAEFTAEQQEKSY